MSFYQTKEGVTKYIEMADGYDGRELVDVLREYLDADASVLEIGIGPGIDLDLLNQHFVVTGSDYSQLFLDRYRKTHPDADLIQLDGITLQTDRRFDALYSNKVLHHLNDSELSKSIRRQHDILNPNGLILHSFWYGDRVDEHAGMKFHYHDEAFLRREFSPFFDMLLIKQYQEMEENDSVLVVGRRCDQP